MINFARGHPNQSCLPVKEMKSLLTSLASNDNNNDNDDDDDDQQREMMMTSCLNYGDEAGDIDFRSSLKTFIDRSTASDDFYHGCCSSSNENNNNNDAIITTSSEKQKRVVVTPTNNNNNIFITNGVSHGIEMLCATQTSPGDVVLVERPTYFLVADIFKSHGLIVKPLPMKMTTTTTTIRCSYNNNKKKDDEEEEVERRWDGIDVEKFIHLVETTTETTTPAPRMIYIIPTHQNPTGSTMDVNRRRALASFVRRNNIILVADEVYHLLDWRDSNVMDGPRPARMALWNSVPLADDDRSLLLSTTKDDDAVFDNSRGGGGCCVSVSSFTKIFAPGVRCGWIEGPEHIIDGLKRYGYIQSQGGCCPFVGKIMHHAITSGTLSSHLNNLRTSYSRRAQLLVDIIETERRITIHQRPLGGYFLWIRFPRQVSAEDFLLFCRSSEEYGVNFLVGRRCDPFHDDDNYCDDEDDDESEISSAYFSSCARLCFADLNVDDLIEGGKRLVAAFRKYIEINNL